MVVVLESPQPIEIRKTRTLDKLYWGDLDGAVWTKWSVSIWDIVKTPEEQKLGHPAMFPVELCKRLIRVYTRIGDVVLDPFMGTGSTLVTARELFRKGIGFEIYRYFIEIAKMRLEKLLSASSGETAISDDIAGIEDIIKDIDIEPVIVLDDAISLDKYLDENSVDMVLTSPPYFNVHRRKRTSDRKEERPYGDDLRDLGNIDDYEKFLEKLMKVFEKTYKVLRESGIAAVIVMDVREGSNFYPLHMDISNRMRDVGFKLRDIVIWNRSKEYNNIRPLGYPNKFIINKIHEYVLVFEK